MYLMLQEPKNKKIAVEEQLVQEVERLKAKVEAGKACFLEKYKECQRLHKQIRQLRAAARVGDRDAGPRSKGCEGLWFLDQTQRLYALVKGIYLSAI